MESKALGTASVGTPDLGMQRLHEHRRIDGRRFTADVQKRSLYASAQCLIRLPLWPNGEPQMLAMTRLLGSVVQLAKLANDPSGPVTVAQRAHCHFQCSCNCSALAKHEAGRPACSLCADSHLAAVSGGCRGNDRHWPQTGVHGWARRGGFDEVAFTPASDRVKARSSAARYHRQDSSRVDAMAARQPIIR